MTKPTKRGDSPTPERSSYASSLARRGLAQAIMDIDDDETLSDAERDERVTEVLRVWLDRRARSWQRH